MYNNNDWDMASKRLEAFWQMEVIDRPCLQVTTVALEQDNKPVITKAEPDVIDAETSWIDPSAYLRGINQFFARTVCMGEALPVLYPNAEHVSRAMGSELQYDFGTIWIKTTPGSIFDLDFSHVTPEHPVIKEMVEYFDYISKSADGRFFIGFPHMGNPGDCLARMRGYDNLCIDLIDEPERCFELEKQILYIWHMCYDILYETINRYMKGSCGWLPAWHPERCALIEFDFCALISPELFRHYIPFLIERAAHTKHAIYHLDGPDALRHLDIILGIQEIGFIQWEPGAGGGDILDWLDLMKRIQSAGKGLYIGGGSHPVWKAEVLLKELQPEGLMIPVYAENIAEAERFLHNACINY